MINILSSNASKPSGSFKDEPRLEGEDNIQWLIRNLPTEGTHLVMLGGTNRSSFRLRVAQSHLRHDLAPSHWSHALLLGKSAKTFASTPVYEVSLEPVGGFGFPPTTNGVQKGKLNRYSDSSEYPNVAILCVPVALPDVLKALDRFQTQRSVLDGVELMLRWLAFVWGASRSENPLLDGQGIPSAAMLEIVFGAAGFDLTPGLESRSSCPEAIWQAAKWWHEYYARDNCKPISGAFFTPHVL